MALLPFSYFLCYPMALVIFIITAVLLVVHSVLIATYRHWFLQLKPFAVTTNTLPTHRFTVIVPARNEAATIGQCIRSIMAQQYPAGLFELIVVDDYSTDETPLIVQRLQQSFTHLKLVQLEQLMATRQINSYKKKAIEIAVGLASGDYIVTTDADCTIGPLWLQQFDAYIQQHQSMFIAAPVRFEDTGSFVSRFQCMDFMSLQGITAASVAAGFHSMCNGANLCYSRQAFYEVGGFAGIDNIASGDDMMLMHKIYRRYSKGVGFLFSPKAVVATLPMPTWRDFFNQRIRWASKADKFDDKRIIAVLALVYCFNLAFILLPVAAWWNIWLLYWWIVMLVVKTLVEMSFMLPVARFFGETRLLRYFPVMQPFHIVYTVTAGWLGKFGSYQWKGRKVR